MLSGKKFQQLSPLLMGSSWWAAEGDPSSAVPRAPLKEGTFSSLEGSRCSVMGLALAALSEVCSGSDTQGEAAQPC